VANQKHILKDADRITFAESTRIYTINLSGSKKRSASRGPGISPPGKRRRPESQEDEPASSSTSQQYKYCCALRFGVTRAQNEATDAIVDDRPLEIIQISVSVMDATTFKNYGKLSTFVRPTKDPHISRRVQQRTGITQYNCDTGPSLPQAIRRLQDFLDGLGLTPSNTLMVTLGDWDLGTVWQAEATAKKLETPEIFWQWCDIQKVYMEDTGEKKGLQAMLRSLKLPLGAKKNLKLQSMDYVVRLLALAEYYIRDGFALIPSSSNNKILKEQPMGGGLFAATCMGLGFVSPRLSQSTSFVWSS